MTHSCLLITMKFHPYHLHLLQTVSKASTDNMDSESGQNIMKPEDGGFVESDEASNNGSFRGSNEQRNSGVDSRRCSEGVLAPANWKNTSSLGQFRVISDGLGTENKVKKVKLKVNGITRTINAKSTSDGASAVGSSSTRSSRFPDSQQKSNEDNLDDNPSFSSDKGSGLRGVPWKDFSRSGLNVRTADSLRDRMPDENLPSKQTDKYEPVRKSKRVPKKRLLDGVLDDEDEDDDEIQYLEKVKTSKITADYGAEYEDEEDGKSRKQRKISKVLKRDIDGLYDAYGGDHGSSKFGKDGKKSKSGRVFEDTDYVEEEELGSDGEPTAKRKKPRKESVYLMGESKKEMTVTTRQRALQTGKDVPSSLGASLIEFPNGLPPAPPKKKKEELTEMEQQLKRAEALQRRRMQVEKANRESEAEAIRKILGQDSSRKKREDKMKKRQEELAQEKAANAMILTADHVRWVMGPSGTVVTFPNEMGLPSIFDPKPCSYPPPREKCAGPSCSNPYKYRDSKSKLPLCSLQCYKAIQEKMRTVPAC
ncbi:SWR1 complex subunit 2 isoform X2 [Ricinus communis]|uniref:SWR1 complex subunit 2 isoform X2 n=1 Tax=Ricinus communis TaxID=3988 RepID=UPI0007728556|nr:SWR1 complex subunit 2 isoform X2 [Ricinus communis]|eukprot:XP_015570374.1 SWR1 complex subunit 2 isoform X2 [Ricinus communis]